MRVENIFAAHEEVVVETQAYFSAKEKSFRQENYRNIIMLLNKADFFQKVVV